VILPTSLVGSYAQPDWLIDREKLAGRFPPRVRATELWRVDPKGGDVEVFPLKSRLATAPALTGRESIPEQALATANAFLVDRAIAVDRHILVSIRRPNDGGYLLQILDAAGRQVATDVEIPGRLVGRSKQGVFFVARKGDGYEMTEYHLKTAALPKRGPVRTSPCAPAAAISKARRAPAWPTTSDRSGTPSSGMGAAGAGEHERKLPDSS